MAGFNVTTEVGETLHQESESFISSADRVAGFLFSVVALEFSMIWVRVLLEELRRISRTGPSILFH